LSQPLHIHSLDQGTADRFAAIKWELLDEYKQAHQYPWIVGYSGGKDSTLVLHLVFEMLLDLPPSQRRRPVHVIANDTLVESPLIIRHLNQTIADIKLAASAFNLPIAATITQPEPHQSFWVNLIGRGYPSPNQTFRWCTDRMKIRPTSRYIREQIGTARKVILLLGVRRSESATRSGVVTRYDNGSRLNCHNDLKGCMVFRPIVELTTEDVWEYLATNESPWGGSHSTLVKLYRDASGGECPVIMQKSDAPSCGTTSSRFGCWTCTVVQKDRSLEGFVESGFSEFGPLLDFRDWLASIRNIPERRMALRRNGYFTITKDGTFIPGPFTMETRSEILAGLQQLEKTVGWMLITAEEIELIKGIWADDMVKQTSPKNSILRYVNKAGR